MYKVKYILNFKLNIDIINKIGGEMLKKSEIVDFILSNGTVSQKYIIKRDILNEDISSAEMSELQQQIVASKPVQKLLKSQNTDGWFGYELHGGPGTAMDCTVGMLIDIGVEPYHDFMRKAKDALLKNLNPDPRIGRNFYPKVRGYDFSRCVILGNLHVKGEPLEDELSASLNQILHIFRIGLEIKSLDEVSKPCTRKKYIGHRVYLKDKFFPWISDIIALSSCFECKNSESVDLMNRAIQHISNFMPIPVIFDVAPDSHYIGPISGYSDYAYEDPTDIPKGAIVFWLRDFRRLCSVCELQKIPYFYKRAEKLAEYVVNDTMIEKLTDVQLKAIQNIFGYFGKWKNETQKRIDVYFKCLQLLHESKIDF